MVTPTYTVKKVRMRAAALTAAVKRAAPARLAQCGALVEADAKASMKGGRVKGKARGVPSEPGTPPNVQSGVLRASVAHALTPQGTCVVGPTEWYGKVHEYGGKNHPQRPFMRPALLRMIHAFPALFKGLW